MLFRSNNAILGIVYKRYAHLVFGLCMKYLKNRDDAEDMVIHIFTKLLDDLRKHEISFFKSWLYTYSKNHCLMHLRSFQSRMEKELAFQKNELQRVESGPDEHQNAEEREKQLVQLESAIETLSVEQRTCIRLFFMGNKSYQEISDSTGYSINNVKSFIQNGKRNLRIKMDELNKSKTEF